MRKPLRALVAALMFPALYLLSQLFVSQIAAIIFTLRMPPDMNKDTLDAQFADFFARWQLPMAALAAFLMLLIVLLATRRIRLAAPPMGFVPLRAPRISLLLVIAGLCLHLTIIAGLSLLPIPETLWAKNNHVSEMLSSHGPLGSFLTGCLLLPFTEEVVFRGLGYRILRDGFPVRAAVVLQALIFAAFHLNLLQSFYVFPVAIVLGLVYEWSGSLLAPVLLHVAFNSAGFALSSLPQTFPGIPVFVCAGAALGVLYTLRALYRRRAPHAVLERDTRNHPL
ncbi:MAG: CPBP family intramembrane metalloprotease [Oscillospiraceae bacterium]|jgi:membrane protease YdiL (CAAX protease family)|nr:CPBP family intramembrane metalloprotease [Oscillospiraceae bacterium]